MKDKEWDIFISHASEDKTKVARPLAEALRKAGVRVWLDEHQLKVGDSLSEKIDEGLSHSRFGAVILSPAFLLDIGENCANKRKAGRLLAAWRRAERT